MITADTTWKLSWQRARTHEGFTRGARAFTALAAVLAYGWWAQWLGELVVLASWRWLCGPRCRRRGCSWR